VSVDIIIPSWSFDDASRELAEGCIDNMRETAPNATLVLSHSGDLPANADKADRVLRMDPPQGWATACNVAFLVTDNPWIVVGSVDIRMEPGWLEGMLELADERTIVSPIDVKKGRRRHWDATERGSFWGGWYLFHRSALETVGVLDGFHFRQTADMDWGIRAKVAGYRTVRAESVHASHIAPHHTMEKRAKHPMNSYARTAFRSKWKAIHLGAWERKQ
jgi:GT2 family glycosyltransferase